VNFIGALKSVSFDFNLRATLARPQQVHL